MGIEFNPQQTTNVKTQAGETVAVTGSVEIANDTGNAIPVSGTVEIMNDSGNAIPISGTVTGQMTILGGNVGINAAANIVKIDQTTAGANHTELVDASGNPIGQSSTNPLVVAPSTSVPIVNTVGDVLDVEIKGGANTAAVDANGRLAVDINAGGLSPSVTASLTSITTSDKLIVKTTGTDTVAVTGLVDIGTMPAITVSDVGIKTTANTVKIDSNNNTVQLNTGYQDPNQKPIVNIKNPTSGLGGNIPLEVEGIVTLNGVSSVNFTNTSINANITNDQLEVKNDIGNPLSVYFPNEPIVTINSTNAVKVDGSAVTQPISGTVKIDQATAGANNIRIVDKTNTSHVATVGNNGSVHTVITNDTASAVPTTISSDVTTLNKAVWAIDNSVPLSKTHFSNYFNAVANSTTTTIVSGIAGYRLRLDKIFIHAETNLSSCVHTDTFTLRSQGSSVRDIHVFRGVSAVTTGFVYDFIPPDGGLLLEDGANLSIFNNNMSAGTPGFNMQVTLFYQFV